MAPRKSVSPLEELCLPFVAVHLKTIVDSHCERAEFEEDKMVEDLKMVLRYVPPTLHDQVAYSYLKAVVAVFGDYAYSTADIKVHRGSGKIIRLFADAEPDISYSMDESESLYPDNQPHFHRLMSVIAHLRVKKMTIGDHPVYVERKISKSLDRMTGFEEFNCTHSWDIVGAKAFDFRKLSKACPPLSNLTSFTFEMCTDKILSAICDNCRALRLLNVKRREDWWDKITDASVPALGECKNLEMVGLVHSAVTSHGFLKLLFEAKSKGLVKMDGLEAELNAVLSKIEHRVQNDLETFLTSQLRALAWRDPDGEKLHLFVKYFPLLTEILLNFQRPPTHRDFSVLSKLTRLKRVNIEFHHCSPNDGVEILSTCPCIRSVLVQWGKSVSELSVWLGHISELCPNVENIDLHQQEQSKDTKNTPRAVFPPNSFQKLTKFKSGGSALLDTQEILCQAVNLQFFQFASPSVLADEFFETVFKQNALNQLKHLRLTSTGSVSTPHCSISCDMAKRIVLSCEQLTNFYIHFPSRIKKPEYLQLKQFISENNYAVDFQVYGLY